MSETELRPLVAYMVETGCSCCGSESGECEVWLLLDDSDVPQEADGICSNAHGYGMVSRAVRFDQSCDDAVPMYMRLGCEWSDDDAVPMYVRPGCEWSDDPSEDVPRITQDEIDAYRDAHSQPNQQG